MSTNETPTQFLLALSQSAEANKASYQHSTVATQLLERFPNPLPEHRRTGLVTMHEHVSTEEFTCVCPITGQPDYASIHVWYRPDAWCFESKAFKLYLGSFRNAGMFHEAVTLRIMQDLVELVRPFWLMVDGDFAPRGGIKFHPRACFGLVPSALCYSLPK